MTEARIECTCAEYHLPELGLVLRRGQVVWVDESKAKRSRQLTQAVRARAVQVKWVARCEVAKPVPPTPTPVPPWLRRKPRVAPVATPNAEESPRTPDGVTLDQVREVVREEVQRALLPVHPAAAVVDLDAIEGVVRRTMSGFISSLPAGAAASTSKPPTLAGTPDPVFIPSGIVPTDTKSAITVDAETTGASVVDDASAALKAARGGSKRKPKET